MNFPKPLVVSDPQFVEWIRNRKCWHCSKPPKNDPHHVLGRDRDDVLLPLCRQHHDYFGARKKTFKEVMLKAAAVYRKAYLIIKNNFVQGGMYDPN